MQAEQNAHTPTPWVSFCTSTYRRPAILKKTLSLLQKQTFTNFEVVVSDNDPEGSAGSIVAAFQDSRFRYFPNGTNLGMIRSFNKSIERSRGQFIVLFSDDDPAYPDMLQVLYDLHLKYPGYGLYYGGHDTVFNGLLQAKMAKARVGTNSGLANWDLGVEKVFSAAEFPRAFLDGTIGTNLLWSTGIVRRDIAVAIGGLPDYDTPHMADCSYIILAGAQAGGVYVNIALGCHVIHDTNYSHAEANYESLYRAPEAFYQWTLDRLPTEMNTAEIKKLLAHWAGRDMTIVVIAIKKKLLLQQVKSEKFEHFRQRFFKISFLKKWKRKYIIATHFPDLFELFLVLRNMLFPQSPNKFGK